MSGTGPAKWQPVWEYEMATRFDISDNLIHFTRGNSINDAFTVLRTIIAERRLIAGNGMIKGGYRCVCFTEAPLMAFRRDFVSRIPFTRYFQFGLLFSKTWVYEHGGRPVIYQPEADFDLLPQELRWRHVRFELTGEQVVDFTWEREWRIRCTELAFSERDAVIVVPNQEWADALVRAHDEEQDIEIQQYSRVVDLQIAELWRESFGGMSCHFNKASGYNRVRCPRKPSNLEIECPQTLSRPQV